MLSFDGVYQEVWNHREQLKNRDVTLFFCGAHLDKDNTFDIGQPYGRFLCMPQLEALRDRYGMRLGYHSLTHRNLTELSDEEVIKEVTPPFPMESFAYPYGNVDKRVASLVEKAGYLRAYSVRQGDGSQYQLNRPYLNW